MVVSLVLAVLAALVHVYIFVLESLRWTHPNTRRVFQTSEADAQTTRALAFNQGFYNLFLAIGAMAGVLLVATGQQGAGAVLVFALGSMVAAAIVLISSDPGKARAALVQGSFPALSLLALAMSAL